MKTQKLILPVAIAIFSLTHSSLAQAPLCPPASSMVAWWPGDVDARDIQGTNNGTFTGTAGATPALVGQGFRFQDNGGILVPTSPSLNFGTNDFTVEFWVRFRDLQSTGNGIISKDTYTTDAGTTTGWLINICGTCPDPLSGVGTGGFGFETRRIAGYVGPHAHARWHTSNMVAAVWYHVAAVRRSSVLHLYLDGVLRAATAEPAPTDVSSETVLTLGTLNATQIQPFSGVLDEVTIYSRALSETEIGAIAAARSAGKCKPPGSGLLTIFPAVELCWPTETNKLYQVQFVTSVGNTNWMNFGIPIAGTGTQICVLDSTRETLRRFYRLETLP